MVLAAVAQNGSAISFADPALQTDPEVRAACLKQTHEAHEAGRERREKRNRELGRGSGEGGGEGEAAGGAAGGESEAPLGGFTKRGTAPKRQRSQGI